MQILLIEDDIHLCETMCFHLHKEGHHVTYCYDGQEGLEMAESGVYDLIILDRMLPSLNGIHILKRLRSLGIHTTILMVTALDNIDDRVTGLDAGADDYLSKPFATKELLARVRALSRRPNQWENTHSITYGDIELDLTSRLLSCGAQSCSLSKREHSLLEFFIKNPNQALSRNVIFTRVWGASSSVEDGNLDNYIHFLRRRLKSVGSTLSIKTVHGIGYVLEIGHA